MNTYESGGQLWWVNNLLVSRLYNPDLRIATLVDRAAAVEAHPTVGPALRAANIRVVPMDNYTQPGSRTAQMTADGPGFYQRYNEKFKPDVVPGPARISEITNYLSQFCTQSDLANADGVDYVLTMDADSMLVDGFMETLGYRMVGGPGKDAAGILTFAEWSSQASSMLGVCSRF